MIRRCYFSDISYKKLNIRRREPSKGRMSGRDRYFKIHLDNDVRKNLNLDTKLKGRKIEEIIIPSNITDISINQTRNITRTKNIRTP